MTEPIDNHPFLAHKEIHRIRDWMEWHFLWKRADTASELLGLLHTGFTFKGITEVTEARVSFYLDVANGYRDPQNFQNGLFDMGRPMMLHELAKKAMRMLCVHFFRNSGEKYGKISWLEIASDPVVFEKLLCFFTPTGYKHRSNLPPAEDELHRTNSFEDEILVKFLSDFFWVVFSFEAPESVLEGPAMEVGRLNKKTREMFFAARPRVIEIMFHMKCVNSLLHGRFLRDRIYLDNASMNKLFELATVRSMANGEKPEYYGSVSEAILSGSATAITYFVLHACEHEWKRREEITKAGETNRLVGKNTQSPWAADLVVDEVEENEPL